MVAGDLVNTASRIQSEAEPGTVLVGEATKRATEAAIAYEDAGTHELKGKAEPMQLFRALRVIAGRAGALRSGEPRAAVRRPRPRAPPGQGALPRARRTSGGRSSSRSSASPGSASRASPGSSRSTSTGLPTRSWWHRGRCLSYGEGVAYWALAEMVRMRCGIAEDEDAALRARQAARDARAARPRPGGASLGRAPPRPPARPRGGRRRRPGGPVLRLAGPVRATRGDRPGRCSCSRTCSGPTPGCSTSSTTCSTGRAATRSSSLVARAARAGREAPDRGAPGSALSPRYTSSRSPRPAMESLLAGLVPGLPGGAAQPDPRARRGRPALCRRDGADAARPRPARARRDRVPADGADRDARGAGDAARPRRRPARRARLRGAAARPGCIRAREDVHKAGDRGASRAWRARRSSCCSRRSCARRCSRSRPIPARPSAASTRSSRTSSSTSPTRRCRSGSGRRSIWPLPQYLATLWGGADEDEVVEVVAAHYLDAWRAAPDGDDAAEIKGMARDMLIRAAERASSLGANAEAQRRLRAGDRADGRRRRTGRAPRTGRCRGRGRCAGGRGDRALRGCHRALRERRARPSGGAGLCPAGRGDVGAGEARGGGREPGARVRGPRARTSRTRRWPRSPRSSGRFMFFAGEVDVARAADRDRARPRRGAVCCRRSSRRR